MTDKGNVSGIRSVKKLTGVTGASEGNSTSIPHGLALAKIIGLNVLVIASNGNYISPGLSKSRIKSVVNPAAFL